MRHKLLHLPIFFFGLLFLIVFFLFKNMFTMHFILDDYFFLHISHANTVSQFLSFFSPLKDYFYRPIPTELFYFLINSFSKSPVFGHWIMFVTYCVGLVFLYKSACLATKKKYFALLFTFFYAIHFTHVFQLYALNTFQEIALFTFLVISFFFYLKKKFVVSVLFFIFALMSKETALMFPIFLLFYSLFTERKSMKQNMKVYLSFLLVTFCFALIYSLGVSQVSEIDIYKIQANPQLIVNNAQWYFLWALGVPNFVPNYIAGLFRPLPEFWSLLQNETMRIYFYQLIGYISLLLVLSVGVLFTERKLSKKYMVYGIFFVCCFFIFLLPVLPIIHRWMVRLTIPILFLVFMQSFIIYRGYFLGFYFRILSIVVCVLFITVQVSAIPIHESSGLFFLENMIVKRSEKIFTEKRSEIRSKEVIYFADTKDSILGGSKKLTVTFHDQDFLDYFFPNDNIRAVYGFQSPQVPANSYIIMSNDLLK